MYLAIETLLRLLAEQTRLRCVSLLYKENVLSLAERADVLDLPQTQIPRHLTSLQLAKIVSSVSIGQDTFYQLHPQLPDWAREILRAIIGGIGETEPYARDRATLARLPDRAWSKVAAMYTGKQREIATAF